MTKLLSRIAIVGVVCLVGRAEIASIAPHDDPRHRSSLRATVTTTNGTTWAVTLQGVGCPDGMCSRVRAQDINAGTVWLDGLVSVREISHNAEGPVTATFMFRDGTERRVCITPWNRVLYVQSRLGSTKQLDLAGLARIDFE